MGTIESRLAALEKLYYNQSIQLATCRLEVVALQDVLILFGETDPDRADLSIEDFRRGVWALMPSEPTSAAARQLLGLPVKEVRMQEEPEPKQREYPALRWEVGTNGVESLFAGNIEIAVLSPNQAWGASAKMNHPKLENGWDWPEPQTRKGFQERMQSAREWIESKFREWFDSLFDQPK